MRPEKKGNIDMSVGTQESQGQIVTVGTDYLKGLHFERYVLDRVGPSPRVGFLPTASNDDEGYVEEAGGNFPALGCELTPIALVDGAPPNLRELILEQDILWIGGGDTEMMLDVWKDRGLPPLLVEARARGTILAGVSAVACALFQMFLAGRGTRWLDGLGLLPGSCCPHYEEDDRRNPYHELVAAGTMLDGWGLPSAVAARFEGDTLAEVVSPIPGAAAYEVRRDGDSFATTRHAATLLS